MKNYYPPGVSGNEPEIAGYPDDEQMVTLVVSEYEANLLWLAVCSQRSSENRGSTTADELSALMGKIDEAKRMTAHEADALVIVKGGNACTVAGDADVYIWDWDNWSDDAGVGREGMLRDLAAFPRHLRVVIERDLDALSRTRLRKLLSEATA